MWPVRFWFSFWFKGCIFQHFTKLRIKSLQIYIKWAALKTVRQCFCSCNQSMNSKMYRMFFSYISCSVLWSTVICSDQWEQWLLHLWFCFGLLYTCKKCSFKTNGTKWQNNIRFWCRPNKHTQGLFWCECTLKYQNNMYPKWIMTLTVPLNYLTTGLLMDCKVNFLEWLSKKGATFSSKVL